MANLYLDLASRAEILDSFLAPPSSSTSSCLSFPSINHKNKPIAISPSTRVCPFGSLRFILTLSSRGTPAI